MDISKAKFTEMYKMVEQVNLRTENNDLLREPQAAELLGITLRTFRNYVYNGTIPPSAYTIGIKGKRFYYKSKLMCCE